MKTVPLGNPQPPPLTVVIATLGGDSLKRTLETLNRGSVVPSEILVCIPAGEAAGVGGLSYPNVRVVVTECRGQVAQRALGFRNASYDVVMQLDDDILVDERCVERLLEALRTGRQLAVGPSLMDLSTGDSVYKKPKRNAAALKIYYWLMNGSAGHQPGKIEKCGSAVGIDPGAANQELFDVEWLPGACVMHYRENLVLDDFYPFPGKAYHEDAIHSLHLMRRGIRLKVVSRARCWLKPMPSVHYGHGEFLDLLAGDFRARRYFMRLRSQMSWRVYVFYPLRYAGYVLRKIGEVKTRNKQGNRDGLPSKQ